MKSNSLFAPAAVWQTVSAAVPSDYRAASLFRLWDSHSTIKTRWVGFFFLVYYKGKLQLSCHREDMCCRITNRWTLIAWRETGVSCFEVESENCMIFPLRGLWGNLYVCWQRGVGGGMSSTAQWGSWWFIWIRRYCPCSAMDLCAETMRNRTFLERHSHGN